MKLYRSLDKFDLDKNFTAWLLALAKHYLIDEYRRTKLEKRSRDDFEDVAPTLAGGDDPERGLAEAETRRLLWSGLDRLPADIRLAVILKEIQGKTYEEVAEISGHRSLAALERYLDQDAAREKAEVTRVQGAETGAGIGAG